MKRLAFAMIVWVLLMPFAKADESVPLFYTRTNLTLIRQSVKPLPWNPAESASAADINFDTEIRDGATLYNQQGWYNLSAPSENSAVMLVFGAPLLAPITPSANYAPLDILLIDSHGTVIKIFPKLRLSSLQEEIYPDQPITAFLFLRSGACEALSINPGDYVQYKIFKRPPATLEPPQANP